MNNVKEFLSKACLIDKRINIKIEQIVKLRELAAKANSVLSDMPPDSTRNFKKMEDAIVKIIDLEKEISEDVNNLTDLKQRIVKAIKKIKNAEYQTILEMRYLCFDSCEKIAANMRYSTHQLYRLHGEELCALKFELMNRPS
ncbi:MAG: hypothetical protein NkDv07_0419 [Candidatus Improbicoccus devescovinae]|nr:MAG: hypothetical protein NkDv07_0419 [Candidatus Improbicoccus devescovinae]